MECFERRAAGTRRTFSDESNPRRRSRLLEKDSGSVYGNPPRRCKIRRSPYQDSVAEHRTRLRPFRREDARPTRDPRETWRVHALRKRLPWIADGMAIGNRFGPRSGTRKRSFQYSRRSLPTTPNHKMDRRKARTRQACSDACALGALCSRKSVQRACSRVPTRRWSAVGAGSLPSEPCDASREQSLS